jgi:tetratricopeptide (TPR) repeat protein
MIISACTEQETVPADDIDPESGAFLSGKFDDEVAAGLHYKAPGYCLRQIRNTVPQKCWRYAVEGFYYKIPEFKDTSGFIMNWLDNAEVVLPDQNVKSFIQMIRGNEYVLAGNYPEAINCLKESLNLALQCNQQYRANDARRYLARALMFHGDYPQAISLLLQMNDFFPTNLRTPIRYVFSRQKWNWSVRFRFVAISPKLTTGANRPGTVP